MDLFRRKSVTDLQKEAETDHSLKRALGALNLTALGIGAINGHARWGVIRNILLAWVLTLPFAAISAGLIYVLLAREAAL